MGLGLECVASKIAKGLAQEVKVGTAEGHQSCGRTENLREAKGKPDTVIHTTFYIFKERWSNILC